MRQRNTAVDGAELPEAVLNNVKADMMLFDSTQQLKKFSLESVPIGTASITPSENVRNLVWCRTPT